MYIKVCVAAQCEDAEGLTAILLCLRYMFDLHEKFHRFP